MARVAHPADANLGHAGEGAQKSSDKSHCFVGALEGTGELSENVWVLEHVGTCWNMLEHCSLFGARSHNSHVRRVWPVEVA